MTNVVNTDDKLLDSNSFYSSFGNALNGVFYGKVVFTDGLPDDIVFLKANDAFTEYTGLKNVVGKKASELIAGIQQADPEIFDKLGKVALSGQPEQFEIHIHSFKAWFLFSAFSPKKEYFVVIADDITEYKKAEELRRLSEERYARVIAGSDQSYWEWNFPTNEFKVSPLFENMLGYAFGELTYNRTDSEMSIPTAEWTKFVHPDDLANAWKSIDQHLQGQSATHELEIRCMTKSGEWKWLLVKGRITAWNHEGKPQIMSGTHTDITERKKAEEALRRSEERLMAALSSAQVAVFEQDLELRYTYVQQPSFGFSPEQVLGKTDCDLFEPETAAKFDTLKRCVIETSTPFRKEIGVSALGRPIQYFDISIAPRKDDIGNITGVLCAAINIDEQFQARERERQQKNVYHALSEINDAIIHQENEGALLTKVCQIAVECGVMSHASIGIPNETGKLIPAAHFGKFTDPSHSLVVSVNPDVQEGQGPSGIAYRENRVFIINDVLSNEMVLPWRERALKDGTNALAVYPIQRSGKPYAVMSIYSDKKDAFNNEIVKLFHSMSLNISLALDHYDHEAARRKAEQALQESDHRLRLAQQAAHMGAFDWDFHTNLVKSSTEIEVLYGFSEGEFDGTYASWLMRVHPDDRSNAEQQVQEALRTGRMAGKWRVALKDGTLRWISSRGQVFYDENGRPLRMIGINIDITQQKLAEEANSLAAKIYQDSSEAMMVLDENHYIIMVNQAFTEITGHEAADIIGTKPSFLRTGHDDAFYDAMWAQIDAVGRFRGEVWHKKKSGELFAVQNTTNKVTSDEGDSPRYVVLLSDITEKKRSADLIWFQANFDSLTGLPNRLFFRNRLEHEIINSKRSNLPLAVMFLDLDGFKDVNDTLGHDMGDVLLKEAADRLRHCVRESDTVARLGGDEFTIILTELHVSRNVDRVAHQILHALSEPIQLGEDMAYVSASIGITLFPNDSDEVEDLIKNADQAMYAAKEEGKNRYHYFTSALQEAAIKRMHLINDLRGALEDRQLEIVYQPIIELSSGSIQKAEALIRWNHPVQGLINPIDFISAAEDTGMISSFGNWVFHEAAQQAAVWREKYNSGFQISINISPVQFRNEGIDSSVWLEHLQKLGLAGQGIIVEITEGLLLDASPKVREQLLMLRDAGIEVSLDDFGTGYSSLAYLKKFDIDYIKIDQAFVRNLTSDSDDMALCEAIIVMAHKLDLKVVAEGIETLRQHELLANSGCNYAQGYLFSKPISASQFEDLLKADPFSTQRFLSL